MSGPMHYETWEVLEADYPMSDLAPHDTTYRMSDGQLRRRDCSAHAGWTHADTPALLRPDDPPWDREPTADKPGRVKSPDYPGAGWEFRPVGLWTWRRDDSYLDHTTVEARRIEPDPEPETTPEEIAEMDAHANEQNQRAAALHGADLAEAAWGIIANANEGNWRDADPKWVRCAEAWRDCYHGDRDSPWPDSEPEPVTVPVEVGLLALGAQMLAESAAWFPEVHRRGRDAVLMHLALGVGGEAGEVLDVIKKADVCGWAGSCDKHASGKHTLAALGSELADVLTYLLALASHEGIDVEAEYARKRSVNIERWGDPALIAEARR